MTLNLTGLIGGLIFLAMICIAILLIIIALLLKWIGKKHFVFLKMSMVSIVFFIIGIVGVFGAQTNHTMKFRQNMDDYYGWISFLVASTISVFLLLKKKTGTVN